MAVSGGVSQEPLLFAFAICMLIFLISPNLISPGFLGETMHTCQKMGFLILIIFLMGYIMFFAASIISIVEIITKWTLIITSKENSIVKTFLGFVIFKSNITEAFSNVKLKQRTAPCCDIKLPRNDSFILFFNSRKRKISNAIIRINIEQHSDAKKLARYIKSLRKKK